jgi:hypothetical protein
MQHAADHTSYADVDGRCSSAWQQQQQQQAENVVVVADNAKSQSRHTFPPSRHTEVIIIMKEVMCGLNHLLLLSILPNLPQEEYTPESHMALQTPLLPAIQAGWQWQQQQQYRLIHCCCCCCRPQAAS